MLHTLECCQTQQYYFSYIIYVYYPIATKFAEVANKYCSQIVSDFGSPSSYNSWNLESEPPFTRFFVYNTLSYKHKSQAKKLQGQQIRQINYLFITRTRSHVRAVYIYKYTPDLRINRKLWMVREEKRSVRKLKIELKIGKFAKMIAKQLQQMQRPWDVPYKVRDALVL